MVSIVWAMSWSLPTPSVFAPPGMVLECGLVGPHQSYPPEYSLEGVCGPNSGHAVAGEYIETDVGIA